MVFGAEVMVEATGLVEVGLAFGQKKHINLSLCVFVKVVKFLPRGQRPEIPIL